MIIRASAVGILCVGMGLLATSASAQQRPLKDQLVGTWIITSWEQSLPDGTKQQRFGANPKGVNVFTSDGHFIVMFARPDLPKISSNDPLKPTPQEANAIATGSIAYFGTYTVDEHAKAIDMRIEASTLPNQLGTPQKRTITSLTANELKYENPISVVGGRIGVALKRAPMATTTGAGSMSRMK
jgi:hypothetical protein